MDVNQSIQTRQVDYQNRSQMKSAINGRQFNFERQNSEIIHQSQKQKIVFNFEANAHEDNVPDDYENLTVI